MQLPVSPKSPYGIFAEVYDFTMRDVPYDEWVSYIAQTINESFPFIANPKILELACGTGTMLKMLQYQYPQTIGLDSSPSMLKKAKERQCNNLVLGDMTLLPFDDNSFDFIFCSHDSVNYLQTEENLQRHLEETIRILKPNGLYLTDISTEANVIENFHGKKFNEKHNGWKVQWKNEYFPENRLIVSELQFEIKKDRFKDLNLSSPFENYIYSEKKNSIIFLEQHLQKIFNENVFKKLVSHCGFTIEKICADYNDSKAMQEAQLNVYLLKST